MNLPNAVIVLEDSIYWFTTVHSKIFIEAWKQRLGKITV